MSILNWLSPSPSEAVKIFVEVAHCRVPVELICASNIQNLVHPELPDVLLSLIFVVDGGTIQASLEILEGWQTLVVVGPIS